MVVYLHRTASIAQEVCHTGGQCLFLAGRVGDGEEGKKSFCDLMDDLGGVHRAVPPYSSSFFHYSGFSTR